VAQHLPHAVYLFNSLQLKMVMYRAQARQRLGGRFAQPTQVCPRCHDSEFVTHEQVMTGTTAIAFWTCSSCLRSWPVVKPRMAKVDLRPA
jgi:formate dehydrogenase maturation protein FdhE